MANPFGLSFLGFPEWDPTGAIMQGGTDFGGSQGTTVYDLMSRGYNPGYANAFFELLPNLTTPATIGDVNQPLAGFYPASDYSAVYDLIDAMGRQQDAARMGKLVEGGLQAGQKLYRDFTAKPNEGGGFAPPVVPTTAQSFNTAVANEFWPAGDSFTQAALDSAFPAADSFTQAALNSAMTEAPSAFSSFMGAAGEGLSAVAPYIPYVGAGLQVGTGLLSGTEEGMQSGLVQGAATIANMYLPGLGTLLSLPLMDQIGPSKGWISYPERIGRGATAAQNAGQGLSNAIANAPDFKSLYNSLLDYRGDIGANIPYGGQEALFNPALHEAEIMRLDPSFQAERGVNADTGETQYGLTTYNVGDLRGGNDALVAYLRELERGDLPDPDTLFQNIGQYASTAIPDLPGATGTAHEGKIEYNPADMVQGLRDQLVGTVESKYASNYRDPARTFAESLAKATSPAQIEAALAGLYAGIGNGYGAGAPSVSSFGQGPNADTLKAVIPDFPYLSDQSVPGALRQELGSAYTGAVNKTNPLTGRGGLPAPEGALGANAGQPGEGSKSTRLGVAAGRGDALGSAIFDAQTFLEG